MFRQWNTWILLSSKLYSEKLLSYGQESTIVPIAFQSLKVSMGTNNCDLPSPSSGPPKRKKLLEQELARYVRLLTEHGNPEKVILFGTLATGRIHEWSDIDLVVVEQTELSFFQRLRQIRKLLQPRVGIDVMVYTPEEFNQLSAERPFFRDEIVAKGKVVYERGR
jgi:predicted nucleotidyltransferase